MVWSFCCEKQYIFYLLFLVSGFTSVIEWNEMNLVKGLSSPIFNALTLWQGLMHCSISQLVLTG